MSALPPTATTAIGVLIFLAARGLHAARERLHGSAEARHRRRRDAGSDLADARLAMRDAAVDHREDAAVDDLARVDAGGHAREIERRQRERRVRAEGDRAH